MLIVCRLRWACPQEPATEGIDGTRLEHLRLSRDQAVFRVGNPAETAPGDTRTMAYAVLAMVVLVAAILLTTIVAAARSARRGQRPASACTDGGGDAGWLHAGMSSDGAGCEGGSDGGAAAGDAAGCDGGGDGGGGGGD